MSSSADAVSANVPVKKAVIVGFEPAKLSAPFFLRCGAIIIDYLILMFFPVAGLLIGRIFGNDGARLLNSEVNNIAWLIVILIGFCNMVLLPMVTGQSIGKMIVGIRIVTLSGEQPSIRAIVFRQLLGYSLTIASAGTGFLISVFNIKGRALHDYLSGTIVVYGRSNVRA